LTSAFNEFDISNRCYHISNRCYQVAVIKSEGRTENVGVLENKFWLEASGPNYGQVCRYVVCLNVRRQVWGWFLTITISVRFSHISCPFANTGCTLCQIGYIDLTFKQSLYKQINQTEALYRYVLFIEVRVKNGEHFSRRVMEDTGIRTTVVMRGAWNWDLSVKIVFILKIYLPFLQPLRWTALPISDPVVPIPPSTAYLILPRLRKPAATIISPYTKYIYSVLWC